MTFFSVNTVPILLKKLFLKNKSCWFELFTFSPFYLCLFHIKNIHKRSCSEEEHQSYSLSKLAAYFVWVQ